MRFSTIVVSGVMAALSVSAQNITESVVSGTQAVAPVQATQSACLAACPATDPACRDRCIVDPVGVPNPAINCINNCVQGNGTAAENLAFENCQRACRSSAATVTATTDARPGVTNAMGTATTSGSGPAETSSGSGSGSAAAPTGSASSSSGSAPTGTSDSGEAGVSTSSGAAAATSSSAANAENVRFGMSAVGAFGAFAAIFAL